MEKPGIHHLNPAMKQTSLTKRHICITSFTFLPQMHNLNLVVEKCETNSNGKRFYERTSPRYLQGREGQIRKLPRLEETKSDMRDKYNVESWMDPGARKKNWENNRPTWHWICRSPDRDASAELHGFRGGCVWVMLDVHGRQRLGKGEREAVCIAVTSLFCISPKRSHKEDWIKRLHCPRFARGIVSQTRCHMCTHTQGYTAATHFRL